MTKMNSFFRDILALFDRAFARRLFFFGLFLFFVVCIALLVREADVFYQTDRAVLDWALSIRVGFLTAIMHGLTFFGEALVVWPLTLILLVVLWRARRAVKFASLFVSMVGASAIVVGLKYFFERPRPDVATLVTESGYSFPSGHGVLALAFWGVLLYFSIQRVSSQHARRALLVCGSVFIILIGFSRVYLGVHWPSDVAASFLLGVAWLALVVSQIKRKKE